MVSIVHLNSRLVFIALIFIFDAVAWSQSEEAGRKFLDTLDDETRADATFQFDNEKERKDWSNQPARMHPRNGLSFEKMTKEQESAALTLLRSCLGPEGYSKVTSVMKLDDILAAIRRDPNTFGSGKYWMAVFGEPDSTLPWAWQLDGHHLAVNFTAVNGETSITPMFFGAEPEIVPEGEHKGMRIFAEERAKAFNFVNSLDSEQRAQAVLSETIPAGIFEGPGEQGALKNKEGIRASELNHSQRKLLWDLIDEYLNNAAAPIAQSHREKILTDGDDSLYFAWMGPLDENANVYFRVHGPSVLIEYDNVFLRRDRNRSAYSNHIHTILRDPSNDFGEDLLRNHYAESDHHR